MLIDKIVLNTFKGIENLSLDFKEGINLIYGRNELGKSTIIEAINYSLFEDATGNKIEYKELVPWNRDVKAKVKLYFTIKNDKQEYDKYLVEKSFPKGEQKLFIINNSVINIAEGKKTNEKILSLLGIDEKIRNLYNLLWINQGDTLSIFSKDFEKSFNSDTQTYVKDIIKESLLSKKNEDFYQNIIKKLEEVFTPVSIKNNNFTKHKDKSLIYELISNISLKKKELNDIDAQIKRYNENSNNILQYKKENDKLIENIENKKSDLTNLEEKKKECDNLKNKNIEFNRVKNQYESILKIDEENSKSEKELSLIYSSLLEKLKIKREEKNNYINKNSELLKEKVEIEKKILTFPEITTLEIKNIENLNSEIEKINIIIKSSKLNLTVTPKKNVEFNISIDCNGFNKDYIDKEKKYEAKESIKLDNNELSLYFTGPINKDELLANENKLTNYSSKLNHYFDKYKTNTIGEIRAIYEERELLLQKKKIMDAELRTFNPNNEKEELKKIESEIEELNMKFHNRTNLKIITSLNDLTIDALNKKKTENETIVERNKQKKKEILKENIIENIKLNYFKQKDEILILSKKIDNMLPIEITDVTDELLSKRRDEIALFNRDRERKNNDIIRLSEENRIFSNVDSKKSELDYEYSELLRKKDEEETRIHSLILLKNLIDEEKLKIDNNFILPLQKRISYFFGMITENKYQDIKISNNFKLDNVSANDYTKNPINIQDDILSYGAREQLAFLFRLSIAGFISNNKNLVMLLDDSFVNTDQYRLKKIMSLIKEYSKNIQFLLFTCKEKDYEEYKKDLFFINLEEKINNS